MTQVPVEDRPLLQGVRIVVTDVESGDLIQDVVVNNDHFLLCHGRCYVSYEQFFGKAKQYTIRYDGAAPKGA